MPGFTTAMPTSYKAELPQAIHNHTASSGDDFKCALGVGTPSGTFDAATANYSALGADEVANGNGYTTGGFDFTAANNITPLSASGTAYWQWGVNPSWSSATFSTSGCIIYNASKSNRAVYVGSFGGVQSVTNGTLTLVMPTNGNTTSLLRIQ